MPHSDESEAEESVGLQNTILLSDIPAAADLRKPSQSRRLSFVEVERAIGFAFSVAIFTMARRWFMK